MSSPPHKELTSFARPSSINIQDVFEYQRLMKIGKCKKTNWKTIKKTEKRHLI